MKWGFANCSDWLHWRCDLSLSAAREKVRVAHALKILPVIAAAFSSGELSYSKVRALTRVARQENEDALFIFALKTTASRVEERSAGSYVAVRRIPCPRPIVLMQTADSAFIVILPAAP